MKRARLMRGAGWFSRSVARPAGAAAAHMIHGHLDLRFADGLLIAWAAGCSGAWAQVAAPLPNAVQAPAGVVSNPAQAVRKASPGFDLPQSLRSCTDVAGDALQSCLRQTQPIPKVRDCGQEAGQGLQHCVMMNAIAQTCWPLASEDAYKACVAAVDPKTK